MEGGQYQIQVACLSIGLLLTSIVTNSSTVYASQQEGLQCSLEKYISKSYFEKTGTLIDSKFEKFIKNELPCSSREVIQDKHSSLPRLSVLSRDIMGEGSHRQLFTSIKLEMQPESTSQLSLQSCEVIVIERLPSGVFADPFELQHLVHRAVLTSAAVFGDTNLELPSFRSNRSVVEIHMEIGSEMASANKDHLELNLKLPLHVRYAPLGEGEGFSKVEFAKPDLLMRCSHRGKKLDDSCLLMLDKNGADYKAGRLVWEVPRGIKEHARVVSAVTFISAIVSALVIVVASIYPSDSNISK